MMGEAAVVYYEVLYRNLPREVEDDYRIHATMSGFQREISTCFGEGLDRISAQKLSKLAEFSQFP